MTATVQVSHKKILLGTSQVALNLGQWIQELEHKRMMDIISIHPSISITFSFYQGHRGFDSLSLLLLGEQKEHPVQVISLLQGQIQKNNHLQPHSHLQQIKQTSTSGISQYYFLSSIDGFINTQIVGDCVT